MSVYTLNAVYHGLYDQIIASYPSAYISGVFEPVPESFPAVFIREIGNFSNPANVTMSGVQGVRTSTVEVQIQSNLLGGAKEECYGILSVVQDKMEELFYILQSVNVIEEGDRGIYRIRASYRRVIGSADQMPT